MGGGDGKKRKTGADRGIEDGTRDGKGKRKSRKLVMLDKTHPESRVPK